MLDRSDWKEREIEILALLATGLSDRGIAGRLGISAETVRWYNKQIYDRLGVSSRTHAVHRATALGLLDAPAPTKGTPSIERSPVRYVDNDGVAIAWRTVGSGPVDLLFIHGFLSHLEVAWEDPEFTSFFEQLGRHMRVILFDKRGVGLSDRMQGAPSIEQTIGDARRVLDAAGSKRAFVFGTSEGGAAAVLLASMHPERVRGLVLYGATPVILQREGQPAWATPRELFDQRTQLFVSTFGDPWSLERFAPSREGDERFRAFWSKVLRAAASPSSVRAILEQVRDIDIRPLLPQIKTRTLVVHRTADRLVRVEAGRCLASELPHASLIELPGEDHIYFVNGARLAAAVTQFVTTPDAERDVETWIAIILCELGADARLTPSKRAILEGCAVRQIQTMKNGWMALFDAPNRAVHAARQLQDLARALRPRMALHVGACNVSDGRPIPRAGEIVCSIAAHAVPGQILVSETLRDILAGSGLLLEPQTPAAEHEDQLPVRAWSLVELTE